MGSTTCPSCGKGLHPGVPCERGWGEAVIDLGRAVPPPLSSPRPIPDVLGRRWPAEEPVRAAELAEGARLGDFRVGAVIGSGGMGDVYAGEQPVIGKKVAIKVLKPEFAAQPDSIDRMLVEARAIAAIRHRGIVDVFTFGRLADGRPYLVMEYLDGIALDDLLDRQGSLSPTEAVAVLKQICSALAAVHAHGFVHRDLKPGNVFLTGDGTALTGEVKLLDFGLAKSFANPARGRTVAGAAVGTPQYMSPEQARGGAVDPRTDLYALGVLAFELLTGSWPFDGANDFEVLMAQVQNPAPRVSSLADGVPAWLDDLVLQLMQKEPAHRPARARDVEQILARTLSRPPGSHPR